MLIFLLFVCVQSRVLMSGNLPKIHGTVPEVSNSELEYIIMNEYRKISSKCNVKKQVQINIAMDSYLLDTDVLAYANTQYILNNGVWVSSVMDPSYTGTDMVIRVNPKPTNGWHTKNTCDDIYYRYNLPTVLRHELLHAMGLISTIYFSETWQVGNSYGTCYPSIYDTLVRDISGNRIVNNCHVQNISGKQLFLGEVELFNPKQFEFGSSLSHHNHLNQLMYWKLTHDTCLEIGAYETAMMNTIGIECNVTSGSKPKTWTLGALVLFGLFGMI